MMTDPLFSRRSWLKTSSAFTAAGLTGLYTPEASGAPLKTPALSAEEIASIESAIGKKGTYNEAQAVHTIALPRNDLKIAIKSEGVPISFGFGGWVSIKKTVDGKSAVLMSDTVLLQEEVNPLISAAQAAGLEVGAIHNHFFYEEPRIFYMHFHGMGSPAELAKKFSLAIRDAKIAPANQPPQTASNSQTAKELFDISALDAIVKYTGVVNGPTYKYTVGRQDLTVLSMGAEMTAAIGLNSWASFAGTKANAHIAGDIAMLGHEVNSVIKVLRAHNLEVVAVHNHMLDEEPRMIFLHYYGKGAAEELAKGFRSALDVLGKTPQGSHPSH
ncbi:DUF1259 domain-containing protein [Dyadobacter sp.]|uniref:DUF1259 domain-containing protein n=1 Tax=Dyadobacter sp. TaxID=1914288 RepID=UPI0025BDB413|nr:DUF1259 domain-containing protein [Dyadobacter sp.]